MEAHMSGKLILGVVVTSVFATVNISYAETRGARNRDTVILDSQYSTTDINGPSVLESRTNLSRSEYRRQGPISYQDPRGRYNVVVCTSDNCPDDTRYYIGRPAGHERNEDVKRNLDGDSYFSDK
jgi:hypothetical protein